jgi:hypothetical protein
MKLNRNLARSLVSALLGVSLALLPLSSLPQPAAAAPLWTRYSGEITLQNQPYVVDSCILRTGSTYEMWYTHLKSDLSLEEMAANLSAAGLDNVISDISNINLSQLLTDLSGADVVRLKSVFDGLSTVIGYATSVDGKVWQIVNSDSLSGASAAVWSSVASPSVIKDGATYKMWYTRNKTDLTEEALQTILNDISSPDPTTQRAAVVSLIDSLSTVIGYATSANGADWTVQNPEVLNGGSQGLLHSVASPSVIFDGTTYHMWYTRVKTNLIDADLDSLLATTGSLTAADIWPYLSGTGTVISYATSADGLTWTPRSNEVLAGSGDIWHSVGDPSVVSTGNGYEMWYTSGHSDMTPTNLDSLIAAIQAFDINALWNTYKTSGFTAFIYALRARDIASFKTLLGNTGTTIGYATSANGVDWTGRNDTDISGLSTGLWSSVAAPSVVKSGSSYEIWFTEGIPDLTFQELFDIALGGNLPIGYASYTASSGGGFGGGVALPRALTVNMVDNVFSGLIRQTADVVETIEARSRDGRLTFTIPAGTLIKDNEGNVVTQLTATVYANPPAAPSDAAFVGLAYTFQPNGTTFSPPITMKYSYQQDTLPASVSEKDLFIAYYDAAGSQWVKLDSTVDNRTNTVTARISHFTTFAVMGGKAVLPVEPPQSPLPAAFRLSALTIVPDTVESGQTTTISILLSNTGGSDGDFSVILKLNGVVEARKDVSLSAGSSEKVVFTVARSAAGSYQVDVSGLTGSFTVAEKTVPTQPAAATPTPPPPPPSPLGRWLVIGLIIAAVVAAGVVLLQVVARRKG